MYYSCKAIQIKFVNVIICDWIQDASGCVEIFVLIF